jgi:hypothetical protein
MSSADESNTSLPKTIAGPLRALGYLALAQEPLTVMLK